MAISINWGTRIISIPKADLGIVQLTPTEIRELDLDVFRLTLKDLEDSEDGMSFPDTHRHNTEVTLGGLTFARVIEIINDYTITFEDGQYAVNLIGANSNVADMTNVNQVSVRSQNSAGLIVSYAGGGASPEDIADAVCDELLTGHTTTNSLGKILSDVGTNTTTILSDTGVIKSDTTTIKGDTVILKADTVTLKADTTTLKNDATTLKNDTVTLKSDTTTLKGDTVTLKADTVTLKADTTTLKNTTNTISSNVDTANVNINAIDTNVDEMLVRLSVSRAATLDSIAGISTTTTLIRKILKNRLVLSEGSSNNWILYDDDNVTPLIYWNVTDKTGATITIETGVPARRIVST